MRLATTMPAFFRAGMDWRVALQLEAERSRQGLEAQVLGLNLQRGGEIIGYFCLASHKATGPVENHVISFGLRRVGWSWVTRLSQHDAARSLRAVFLVTPIKAPTHSTKIISQIRPLAPLSICVSSYRKYSSR
jgi:hypothetical protein